MNNHTDPYYNPFTSLRCTWHGGLCAPEYQGETIITIQSTQSGSAKLRVVRKAYVGSKSSKLQATKIIPPEVFAQLQLTLSRAKLNFAAMPSFALDACTYSLQLSGDAWGFEYGYTGGSPEDGLEEFRNLFRDLYEPVLEILKVKIRALLENSPHPYY